MSGFAYTVSNSRSIFPAPSYEAVRSARPHVVADLRANHRANMMFFAAAAMGEPKCIVYAAINKVNNKLYVGATETGLVARRTKHFWSAARGYRGRFYSAIRKYGETAFEFIILSSGRDFFDVLNKECAAIAAIMPEYNLTAGGGGIKGFRFTPEQIEKGVSKRRGRVSPKKGIRLSSEQIAKTSAGVKRWWRENKEKLTKIAADNVQYAIAARRKKVMRVSDGMIFNSASEAARHHGLRVGQVSYSCARFPNHKPRKIPIFRYANG